MKLQFLFVALACGLAPVGAQAADACVQGYVWREAYPGDATCVRPDRRDAAAADNRAARLRVAPGGGGAYGPATCRNGYVWREARAGDLVCVTPEVRQLTAAENRASGRYQVGSSTTAAPRGCAAAADCAARLRALQLRLADNRRQREDKQRQLALNEQRYRKTLEDLRRSDEEWARKNPGLGRSTQPSVTDDVTPLRTQIQSLDKAYAETQRQLAALQAGGATAAPPPPPPSSR